MLSDRVTGLSDRGKTQSGWQKIPIRVGHRGYPGGGKGYREGWQGYPGVQSNLVAMWKELKEGKIKKLLATPIIALMNQR